jgi:hypothetical protein
VLPKGWCFPSSEQGGCDHISDGMVQAGYGEKIMSKTTTHNTEIRKVTAVREPTRELSAVELAQVTGGDAIPTPHTYAIGRIEARFPR